jgi:hypothetical protein
VEIEVRQHMAQRPVARTLEATSASKIRKTGKYESSDRAAVTLATVIYWFLFVYIYKTWASPIYSIYGLLDQSESNDSLIFAFFLMLGTCLALPVKIRKFSDYAAWIIFLVVYIPAATVAAMQGYKSFNVFYLISATTFAMLCISTLPHMFYWPKKQYSAHIHRRPGYIAFLMLAYTAATGMLVILFWGNMSLVGVEEVFEQRARAQGADAGALASYVASWMSYAINPYFVAVGLAAPRLRSMLLIGILGQILMYSIFAGKIIFVGLFAMITLWYFAVKDNEIKVPRLVFGVVSAMLLVVVLLIATNYQPTGFSLTATSQLYMRALALQGAMLGVYHDFFQTSPLTYGSHINGVNLFVTYPYQDALGFVIGKHLVGGQGFNANASFIVTDGVSSFGIIGVLMIGIIVGGIFAAVNHVVTPDRLPFAAVATLPFLMALANVSFFTSIITGGGWLLVIFIAMGSPAAKK